MKPFQCENADTTFMWSLCKYPVVHIYKLSESNSLPRLRIAKVGLLNSEIDMRKNLQNFCTEAQLRFVYRSLLVSCFFFIHFFLSVERGVVHLKKTPIAMFLMLSRLFKTQCAIYAWIKQCGLVCLLITNYSWFQFLIHKYYHIRLIFVLLVFFANCHRRR